MSGKNPNQEELFTESSHIHQQGPVKCLGITFESDEARRTYFIERLREILKDPAFRKIEGFPTGEDEDILRLSDPPYYTACPNPFLNEVISEWQKERQMIRNRLHMPEEADQHEPFAADVSEGKTDPVYNAHPYHTKVPHKAIMRYILHYTEPGDIVFDGFCGTGMSGVAAQLCKDKKAIGELGYRVDDYGIVWDGTKAISRLGSRRAVINDLSPAATFIAYNYNSLIDTDKFKREAKRILSELERKYGWMYETWHPNCDDHNRIKARIDYTVWSEVQACPNCSQEIIYSNEALNKESGHLNDTFLCPNCKVELKKGQLDLLFETRFDSLSGKTVKVPRRKPVLINYKVGKKKYEKVPDNFDLKIIEQIDSQDWPTEIPSLELPEMQMAKVGRMKTTGVTSIQHFFLKRQAYSLASLWNLAESCSSYKTRSFLLFFVEQAIWGMSVLNRYKPLQYGKLGGSQVGLALSGVFYVASVIAEVSPWYNLEGKLDRLVKTFQRLNHISNDTLISTENLGSIQILENSVDYIFTDPPFGENIYYSDLNILIESFHRVLTSPGTETIVDRVRGKNFQDYERSMQTCFDTYFHALKPGRWITIEFHNSQNSVWNAIQNALQLAGFVIADVRTLNKVQGSFQQVSSATAVKQDLVISAYKPNGNLEGRTRLTAGTEESAWEFVRYHLGKVPVVNHVDGKLLVSQERQAFLLFDRMVSFHVHRGILVPLSSAEFYSGLSHRFPERDHMYFLPDQVGEYDQARLNVNQIQQLQLFVNDESSAILWLRQELETHPQTYSDIFPKFIREISAWQKNEKVLELAEMLAENFIKYEGSGPIPEQIWGWMQRSEELRDVVKGQNREAPTGQVSALAKDRWFVPDPNNAQQMEKSREGRLLKEFENYKSFSGKKLKVFRLEAVRAGFKKAWQDTHYQTIIDVAEKIPEEVLQQDPKLLMWYDQALTRLGR